MGHDHLGTVSLKPSNVRPQTQSWKRMLWSLLGGICAFYLLLCLGMFFLQKRMVYHPGPPPELLSSAPGEPVSLTTKDGLRLGARFIEAPSPRGAILFSHGNAGTLEGRLPAALVFRDMGWDVLLYDYRGYGDSEGSPDEEGSYLDAEAAYDWVAGATNAPPGRIVSYGESLGAAVAIELSLRRPVAAVIAEAGFRSVPDLAGELFPWLPVRWLSRYKYESIEKVDRIGSPLLVVHSPDDDLIPFAHGHSLFERAMEPKTFLETRGGHNAGGFLQESKLREQVKAFLDETCKTR